MMTTSGNNWFTSRDISVASGGKHQLVFPPQFPLLVNGYRFSFNHRLTPNCHDYFEVTFVQSGSGRFVVDSKVLPVKKGDIFVVGDTQFHTLETSGDVPITVVCVFFMPDLVFRAGGNPLDFEYVRPFFDRCMERRNIIPASHPASAGIIRLAATLRRIAPFESPGAQLDAKTCLLQILGILASYYAGFPHAQTRRHIDKQRDIRRLEKVFALLQDSFQDNLSLERAARTACMSETYFCKFFKKVTGNTFTEYLSRLRIDKAKALLLRGDVPVSRIAYDVGFESHSYFDRTFHRHTGLSPSDFSSMARRKRR